MMITIHKNILVIFLKKRRHVTHISLFSVLKYSLSPIKHVAFNKISQFDCNVSLTAEYMND